MAGTFEELGIAAELLAGAEATGWVAPTALQRDAIPVLRRGNNAVLHAAPGSGASGAYGLAILDRLASGTGNESLRALVLVPSLDAASRTADSLAHLATPAGLATRALAPGWPSRPADLLVASATTAVAAIRDSSLKLDALTALVIDGADQLAATGQWDALETILEAVPSGTQRILVTARFDATIDAVVERNMRKAMTIPPRPSDHGETGATTATVRYVAVPERDRTAAVVALLASVGDAAEVALVCRTPARAEQLTTELTGRGVALDGEPRILVLPRLEADRRSTQATVISCDVPFDAHTLGELHERGGAVVAMPRELAHLRLIASRAGIALDAAALPVATAVDPVAALRQRLGSAARSADLAAELALLEPLLDEFPAAELAAAALYLSRPLAAPDRTAPSEPGRPAASAGGTARSAAAAPPPTTAWIRLFITAGTRDGLGPGDLVGAITGETGLAGDQVGKIEVRESHSTVEVPSGAAESVIAALNGRSLRGRSLRVDYDRKERAQKKPPARGGSGSGGSRPGGSRPGGSRPGGRPRPRD